MNERYGQKVMIYARVNTSDPTNLGAVKKYRGLLKGFRDLGFEADLLWLSENGILLNEKLLVNFRLNVSMESARNVFFNFFLLDWHIAHRIDFRAYDIFFVRFPLCHPMLIYLLRKAKKSNPALKIWLEVPTYPYHLELKGFLRNIQYRLDRLLQPLLKRYVDRVVQYGQFPSLFGIPAIGIGNGVDVSSFPVSTAAPVEGKLRLLAVGNWNHWHGLDRLLSGMASYYDDSPEQMVELTIVGGGRELPALMELAEKHKLTEYVKFISPTEGLKLDKLFNHADIAIGTLGIHRKKVVLDSSLKHREYCARGIPLVLSTLDPDFPVELPWVHYVSTDDAAISISALLLFWEKLKHWRGVKDEIRKYAIDHIDWRVKLKNMIEQIGL